ncbi:MAG TPA: rhodanese-like domain-containing protein [Chryseolinea sp.]
MILDKIRKWLGIDNEVRTDYKTLVEGGAQIIDVRTPSEFSSGHIPNSINIPITHITKKISRVAKDRQIILVCASGMRSASARNSLLSMGYLHVHNGGSWTSLMKNIN